MADGSQHSWSIFYMTCLLQQILLAVYQKTCILRRCKSVTTRSTTELMKVDIRCTVLVRGVIAEKDSWSLLYVTIFTETLRKEMDCWRIMIMCSVLSEETLCQELPSQYYYGVKSNILRRSEEGGSGIP